MSPDWNPDGSVRPSSIETMRMFSSAWRRTRVVALNGPWQMASSDPPWAVAPPDVKWMPSAPAESFTLAWLKSPPAARIAVDARASRVPVLELVAAKPESLNSPP
ncbi:MAG: hypothetical protein ACYTDY_06200 [Planctomycetota bacterium]|jgi:hypothetical protein